MVEKVKRIQLDDSATPNAGACSLTTNERACLEWTFGALGDTKSASLLLEQIDLLTVTSRDVMHTKLAFPLNAIAADLPDGPVDVMPFAWGADKEPLGHVSVWIEDGYVSMLSFGWVTDEMPNDFPPAHFLTL